MGRKAPRCNAPMFTFMVFQFRISEPFTLSNSFSLLSPSVVLDDLRFKEQGAQFGHPKRHLVGLGVELALVVSAPVAGPVLERCAMGWRCF